VSDTGAGASGGDSGERRTSPGEAQRGGDQEQRAEEHDDGEHVGLPEERGPPPEGHRGKRHEQDAPSRAGRDAGDGKPPVAGARAEGARGADEGPCHRGEQREGDQVDVQVVAMQ
jgi:hypothetical protein